MPESAPAVAAALNPRYRLLQGADRAELDQSVRAALADGWSLRGAVSESAAQGSAGPRYFQVVHGPRSTNPGPLHTREQVRSWMQAPAQAGFQTAQALAEAANAALHLPPEALADDGHWVWEEAFLALERAAV